jgi:hypothetical protein
MTDLISRIDELINPPPGEQVAWPEHIAEEMYQSWGKVRAVLIAAEAIKVSEIPCPCGMCSNTTAEVTCTQTELRQLRDALTALEKK